MTRTPWPTITQATPASALEPALRPPMRELKQIEREAMIDALARCHGNQSRAAELLGMPRRTFCKRLKQHGIPRPRA
jgi:two-component system response regulator AtoC